MTAGEADVPGSADRSYLRAFLRDHRRWLLLTGAGISTDSGIPGYRDEAGRWKHSAPVQLSDFLHSDHARRRYWARSMAGWPRVRKARPNAAHVAVARLEAAGRVEQLVTQNVDGLHQRAGSVHPIELHGNLDSVRCLDCTRSHDRAVIQEMLEHLNPAWAGISGPTAPDGDADLDLQQIESFAIPGCPCCGGLLKPDVVFFGEGVPRPRVDATYAALERADAMLVVGSSLMVYSGYRFCERASSLGKPILIINRGVTRADALASFKLDEPCLPALEFLLRNSRGLPRQANEAQGAAAE